MFQPSRDRDAYAAIRGYVYQIYLTIDRWLRLDDCQALELERGEDIDLVGSLCCARESGTEVDTRLLGQVKYRDVNITLRTPAAVEALANFHDHLQSNSQSDLRFCFLTNAVAGREQFSPLSPRLPGIALWQQIRARALDDEQIATAVGQLQRFLRQIVKPATMPGAIWDGWVAYLTTSSEDEFLRFIDRFEWSTGQPDAERFPFDLENAIVERSLAPDATEAKAVLERFFLHVARLLSSPGTKCLRVSDRTDLLAQPTLPAKDREQLRRLQAVVEGHTARLDRLDADTRGLNRQLATLFLGQGPIQRVRLTRPIPDVSLPCPVARLSSRPQTVADLRQLLVTHGWVSIHGGADTGKSQLARLVAVAHGRCRGWVRFHHRQSDRDAVVALDAALLVLCGWDRPPRQSGWYREAAIALGSESILVFDDMPQISSDGQFAEHLLQLGQAASAADLRVVSTSRFEFPYRLCHELGDALLCTRLIPPFLEQEALELFQQYGAPAAVIGSRSIALLNLLAAGHPLLLAAIAEFLSSRGWHYSDQEIGALLHGAHQVRVMPDVIERLVRTLNNPPRELLYRLTLPIGSFEQAEVAILASVTPAIDRPLERFHTLLGPWVQRDTDTSFLVSPLVRPLGQTELNEDVRKQCYRQLAEAVTRKGTMSQHECSNAIVYNLLAGEHGRALTLYVLLLMAAVKEQRSTHIVRTVDMWRNTPLPTGVSVGNQLFVRAYQLTAFIEFGLDTTYILRDIDALLGQATERDGWGIIALAAQSVGKFRERDASRALRYVRRAIALPALYGPDGEAMECDEIAPVKMLWMLVTELRSQSLLHEWFDAIEALPEDEAERFWQSDMARHAVWMIPNEIYIAEWEKDEAERNWGAILCILHDLLRRVIRLNQPRVEAVIAKMILQIQGERGALEELRAVAETTIERWPLDPDVQFKVRGTWGRICASQGQRAAGLALLDTALAQSHGRNDIERLRCLLAANLCVKTGELRYAEQARELALTSDWMSPLEVARALGEYALSHLLPDVDQAGAILVFPLWSEAMRQLAGIVRKDNLWKDLSVLFAHATGYLVQVARDGEPPKQARDGGPWVAPSRGLLLSDYTRRREELYNPGLVAATSWMMYEYGAAASALEEASFWMRTATVESREVGASFIQTVLGIDAVAELLTSGAFEDALEVGILAGRGMVVQGESRSEHGGEAAGLGIDVMVAFQELPGEKRRLGDQFALILAVVPAAMRIVGISLVDPDEAVSGGRRVAAACRQLADDAFGDRDLWSTAAELFEAGSQAGTNAEQLLVGVRAIEGQGDGPTALRVVGHILATWHANLNTSIHCQLACVDHLLRWFSPRKPVHRLVLLPYVESFWLRAIRESRFALGSASLTTASIEAAMSVPEDRRVRAILVAASGGFRIQGLGPVVQRLREEPTR